MVDPFREGSEVAELWDKLTDLEERIEALELFHQGREKCSGDLALDKLNKRSKDYKVISILCLVAFLFVLFYSVFFGGPAPGDVPARITYIEVEIVEQ